MTPLHPWTWLHPWAGLVWLGQVAIDHLQSGTVQVGANLSTAAGGGGGGSTNTLISATGDGTVSLVGRGEITAGRPAEPHPPPRSPDRVTTGAVYTFRFGPGDRKPKSGRGESRHGR